MQAKIILYLIIPLRCALPSMPFVRCILQSKLDGFPTLAAETHHSIHIIWNGSYKIPYN